MDYKEFWKKQSEDWRIKKAERKIVRPNMFFREWIKFPLFPKQMLPVKKAFTEDFKELSDIHEFIIAWGKRGGKDTLIANLLTYIIYFLLAHKNPHEVLGMKEGENIDIVNVSFDEDQAKTVFFERFKQRIRNTINPITKVNFFKEKGMNLDHDIQKNVILFPKGIRAFSLNCLPYSSKVMTKVGHLSIGEIVHKKIKTEVLSFNKETDKIEWKKITNYFRIEDKNINWYKIETDFNSSRFAGKSIICTDDHKLYVYNKGFVKARDLKVGDVLINNISDKEYVKTKIKGIIGKYKDNEISKNVKYCIEVEDNHNFFANGILVSNSVKFKEEGKNVVFAVFDEIAQFRFDKADAIRRHIKTTAISTCPKYYKLFYISFLTSANDYMATLVEKAERGEIKHSFYMRESTWHLRGFTSQKEKQNNPNLVKYVIHRRDLKDLYDDDSENAKLMFECKIPKTRSNSFIKQPEKIIQNIGYVEINGKKEFRPAPFLGDELEKHSKNIFYDDELMDLNFSGWFKPFYTWEIWRLEREYENNPSYHLESLINLKKEHQKTSDYFVGLDLSRGVVDSASITLGHSYYVNENIRIYLDLMLSIRARKGQEIDMGKILDFIIKRLHYGNKQFRGLGFNIQKIISDSWNSNLFLNLCERENIFAETTSLERTTIPYNTLKDFIYNGDINYYAYPVFLREMEELIVNEKGKIDHPPQSPRRMREEGLPKGSKDVSDTAALVCYGATEDSEEGNLAWGAVDDDNNLTVNTSLELPGRIRPRRRKII